MTFDGKPIAEIADDEIEALVTDHVREQQHLEFKLTVKHGEAEGRVELLRDIASLANGGGGYLIVGIRDDGKGRAQKFEPESVGDVDKIRQATLALCHDHIAERIDGLEAATRKINGNPIVIVRVPPSERVPHMVRYQNRTDFYTRYDQGKREMTIGEIREHFTRDSHGLRLARIEGSVNRLTSEQRSREKRDETRWRIESRIAPALSLVEEGKSLHQLSLEPFRVQIGEMPCFRVAITPEEPRRNLIDVDSDDLRESLRKAPGSRPAGWNMEMTRHFSPERTSDGIEIGDREFEYLVLLVNGHMEFWTPLNQHFCWKQSDEEFKARPRLYPLSVTEYPTTFLRLYKAVAEFAEIRQDLLVSIQFENLQGYYLPPGAASDFMGLRLGTKRFEEQHLHTGVSKIPSQFSPDRTAFDLLKVVYASFGWGADAIPYYDREAEEFRFPQC